MAFGARLGCCVYTTEDKAVIDVNVIFGMEQKVKRSLTGR